MISPPPRVFVSCQFLTVVGVPLSETTATRTEPNKSAIDLAVKALKEKERQHKSEWSRFITARPTTSSIVAYKPKEEHKTVHDVGLARPFDE